MKQVASQCFLGSEFDAFLYASIDDDHHGMPLSVLSALARLDVDPWEEAARLARLPKRTAAGQLASSLAQILAPHVMQQDLAPAARLIALLPRRAVVTLPTLNTLPVIAYIKQRAAALILLLCLIYFAALLILAFNP